MRVFFQLKKHIKGAFVTGTFGKVFNVFSFRRYMNAKTKHLQMLGVDIPDFDRGVRYISPDAYFDGHDYSLIQLGNDVTISREVMILTHDYSLGAACRSMNIPISEGAIETPHTTGAVSIGAHSFIGARASLLPGTKIGSGCIIGACAVVKGNIPDNSIVIGNPGKIVGDVREWANKRLQLDE